MKHDSIFERYKALLSQYIAFKSISTDPAYKDEIQKTFDWLVELFKKQGFTIHTFQGPNTNPVLLAHYHQSDDLETVLVYGHYDVQPADNVGWKSHPYTLTEKDKKVYGRGTTDNKGQNGIHFTTIFDLIEKSELKYNIKFMLEGNEETGNPDMSDLVIKHAELLKADHYLISDGEMVLGDIPTLEVSLRGGMNVKLILKIREDDSHSGLYGGIIPNPILALASIVNQLKDTESNDVYIPGFYYGVPEEITIEQSQNLAHYPTDEDVYKSLGIKDSVVDFQKNNDLSVYGEVGLMPTIEFTGFSSGYTGEGFQNIIPAEAEVRINFRFVEGQDAEQIYQNFYEMLEDIIPNYFTWEAFPTKPYGPVVLDYKSDIAQNTLSLVKSAYGKEPLIKYVGGGIPIVLDFKNTLGKDSILVPLGNHDCNMHGANENISIDAIQNGLAFSRSFFQK